MCPSQAIPRKCLYDPSCREYKDVLQYITLGVVVVMGVVIVVMGIVVAGGCSSFTYGVC